MAAFAWLAELTLRSTLVLTVALGLGLLLRRSRAEARHRLLTLTALGLLVLPALPRVLPSLEVPIALPRLDATEAGPAADLAVSSVARVSGGGAPHDGLAKPALAPARGRGSSTQAAAPSAGSVALIAWLVGVAAGLASLGRALARERRLLRRSHPLAGPWRETLSEVLRSLSMGREVRLLESTEIDTPLTGGWRRPAVLVPAGAAAWSDERRRLVVQHELVHVQRADGLRHLAWRLVAALYWFHPLVRLAERQARLAGEQACDETVVRLGARPSTYARHLLEIAESLRARPEVFASTLPMLDRSQLERRLVMILDENRALGRGRASAIAGLAVLAATVLFAGAAGPQATRPFVEVPVAAAAPASAPVESPHPTARSVTAEPARGTLAGTACLDADSGMSFSGTFRHGRSGRDASGGHEDDYSFQHTLGDGRRLCARVWGPVLFDERTGEVREVPRGSSVLVETGGRSNGSQRMLITEEQGQPRHQLWLNGSEQPVDDRARAWLKDALEAVAAFRAIGEIQGEVGTLQGEIGTIQGRIGTLQGRIGTIQGQQGTLQGKIGSIQGEQGTLQGEIGTHQGAIGSLEGARWSASESLKTQIDKEIQEHEAAIRKLEAEKDDGTLKRRLSEAQAELSAFQQSSNGQIRELERQIEAIRSENQIGRLEKQIDDLHADDRIAEIKRRLAPTLERLKARIAELGG